MLQKLEYFVAVAEEQAISRAAQRINVTQPHLSRMIRSLEEELNTTLIIRTQKGIVLTSTGEQLLEYSRQILSEVEEMKNAIRNTELDKRNELTIALLESVIPYLARMQDHFSSRNPEIHIGISTTALNAECAELLAKGKADLAFVREPFRKSNSYGWIKLGCEPWMIVYRGDIMPGNAAGTYIQAEELYGVPLLLPYNELMISDFCSWMDANCGPARVFGTWSTLRSAIMLASKELCCAICPQGVMPLIRSSGLNYRMLDPSVYQYQTLLVWQKPISAESPAMVFIESLSEYISSRNNTIYDLPIDSLD